METEGGEALTLAVTVPGFLTALIFTTALGGELERRFNHPGPTEHFGSAFKPSYGSCMWKVLESWVWSPAQDQVRVWEVLPDGRTEAQGSRVQVMSLLSLHYNHLA